MGSEGAKRDGAALAVEDAWATAECGDVECDDDGTGRRPLEARRLSTPWSFFGMRLVGSALLGWRSDGAATTNVRGAVVPSGVGIGVRAGGGN